jgi:hypothetical protein
MDPSASACSSMLGLRYRSLRLFFHTSKTSGELTSALSEMTDGKLFRASDLLVSSGANCLHLLQLARVVLSLMMEEARSSANAGASAVYRQRAYRAKAYLFGVSKIYRVEYRGSSSDKATIQTRIGSDGLDAHHMVYRRLGV